MRSARKPSKRKSSEDLRSRKSEGVASINNKTDVWGRCSLHERLPPAVPFDPAATTPPGAPMAIFTFCQLMNQFMESAGKWHCKTRLTMKVFTFYSQQRLFLTLHRVGGQTASGGVAIFCCSKCHSPAGWGSLFRIQTKISNRNHVTAKTSIFFSKLSETLNLREESNVSPQPCNVSNGHRLCLTLFVLALKHIQETFF